MLKARHSVLVTTGRDVVSSIYGDCPSNCTCLCKKYFSQDHAVSLGLTNYLLGFACVEGLRKTVG